MKVRLAGVLLACAYAMVQTPARGDEIKPAPGASSVPDPNPWKEAAKARPPTSDADTPKDGIKPLEAVRSALGDLSGEQWSFVAVGGGLTIWALTKSSSNSNSSPTTTGTH